MRTPSPIPYQALSAHAVIGDRRTAGLVAADGTLDWLCLPDYDGDIVFGSLLDAARGGYWQFGPDALVLGKQAYMEDTALLTTTWDLPGARLKLTDLMAWPADDRPGPRQDQRVVVRRLRCLRGRADCCLRLAPACNFEKAGVEAESPTHARVHAGRHSLRLQLSRPLLASGPAVQASFELAEGETCWAVLASASEDADRSAQLSRLAQTALAETKAYWRDWSGRLNYRGPHAHKVRLSALLFHLLSYAPKGSVVAAPTTSLPERLGGNWNADYRLTWIRDASLSLEMLSILGNTTDAGRFLDWLCHLGSSTPAPLQVVYGIRGETDLQQHERADLYGYRGSRPVRLGNHAYQQRQHDAFGYLLNGAAVYLEMGGTWRPEFWELVRRVADYLADDWQQPDNGIWELSERRRFLSGTILSWAGLNQAVRIAERLGHTSEAERWDASRSSIRAAVLEKGWSPSLGAFRQHLDGDNLDSAALLIPVLGLLPADDPRAVATVERVAEHLTFEDGTFRFDPEQTPGIPQPPLPLAEFEGAFLPCTFWLAAAYARMGQARKAETILRRAESRAAAGGLFAEGLDPRTGCMLGNFPLLFSHAEYVRASYFLARKHGCGISPE